MRFRSETVDGIQLFAVAGTHVVSFGIKASTAARKGLLGFSIERAEPSADKRYWVDGYKVFQSIVPDPDPTLRVSTFDHPMQGLSWDDFYARPGQTYEYFFHPFRGTAADPVRSTPVTVMVTTEPLHGGTHNVHFNRGVTGSQSYARNFGNVHPNKLPDELQAKAYQWLSKDLDEELVGFIESAEPADAIRGCFYEFKYPKVLNAFKAAIDRGVDVELVIDKKVSPSSPREDNIKTIANAGIQDVVIDRDARKNDIQHNKFMVLLKGKRRRPTEVWTGSTNVTEGGIYGQANVGHHVRDTQTAAIFLDYWKLLATDPGGQGSGVRDPANAAFLKAVETISPAPAAVAHIPAGTTPIFSPRTNRDALQLYARLLADARSFSCATFPFTLSRDWRASLAKGGKQARLCFLLFDKEDRTRPTKAHPEPVIALNSKNNIYTAYGSEFDTPLGKWVQEISNKDIALNTWVSYVHLKFILSDPLSADPIIVTGSANFSPASTVENDENMLIIRGDRRVADIYFTEFNRLWGHYYYRSVAERTKRLLKAGDASAGRRRTQFLAETPAQWQAHYQPGDLRTKRVDQYLTMAL